MNTEANMRFQPDIKFAKLYIYSFLKNIKGSPDQKSLIAESDYIEALYSSASVV